MSLLLATLLSVLGPLGIPVGQPRIEVSDLIRSWAWVDHSLSVRERDLKQRRTTSRRLDAVTRLFFQNDLGAVARLMDELALESMLEHEPTDSHRIAASLLLKLDDRDDGPFVKARWRYQSPSGEEAIPFTLVMTPIIGEPYEIEMVLKQSEGRWLIHMDEESLNSIPRDATLDLQMKLEDGTMIPQGRWERTTEPFSVARRRYLEQLDPVGDSQSKQMFRSRAARLVDRVSSTDITGHVLDRNKLRQELAMELQSRIKGEDPYVNRVGDLWFELRPDSGRLPVRLHVPEQVIDRSEPAPLLIALHGAGGNEHFFIEGCGNGAIVKLADEHGIIVACPSTYVMASSMEPLETLIRELSARYSIDQDRIYLLGHSLGGMTAMGLASVRPDMIDGVVAIAGGAPFPRTAEFPPVLAYAAERDFIVSGDMIETSAKAAKAAGAPVTPRRPDGTGHLTIVIDVLPESVRWLMELPERTSADGR